jgi:alcohol dehydrogenase class IV
MLFEHFSVPRILFGAGQVNRLPEVARPLGTRALVVHAGAADSADVVRVWRMLEEADIDHRLLRQRGEPTTEHVDGGLAVARREECDFVIALGGGSAIDAAKAIAGLLANGGEALDYMEVVGKGQKITKPAAPWIAIPTTFGTGAEVTRNAVIGHPPAKFKASIRSEHLLARTAIVDPELGVNVSRETIAQSGMDAMCQLIEAYLSTGATPMTDAIIELAIRGMNVLTSYMMPSETSARTANAFGSLCSGIALANAGLGAVHGFAAPLGANFPVPHGLVCGVLLPHVLRANLAEAIRTKADGTLLRFAVLSRPLSSLEDAEQAVEEWITMIEKLVASLHLRPLSAFGITESHIPEMVELAKRASSMKYNPVKLADEALAEILRRGIHGV